MPDQVLMGIPKNSQVQRLAISICPKEMKVVALRMLVHCSVNSDTSSQRSFNEEEQGISRSPDNYTFMNGFVG